MGKPTICIRENNQRTNGPVNAHLRSAVYKNVIENSPSLRAGEALGPLFFQNNQYTVQPCYNVPHYSAVFSITRSTVMAPK